MKRKSVNGYEDFLGEIKRRIRRAQYDALKAVNKKLIGLYWDLGKMIHEKQVKLGWGKGVVENLAKDIQKEYTGIQGFSADNMWRMRKLFLMYSDNTKLAPMVQEIGWTHNVVIMESCKDNEERAFYIQMTKKFGWTKNVLIHQIEAGTYLRYLKNQTNFNEAVPEKYRNQAKLAVKDEYTFDFLELPEEHEERELEKALIGKINKFLTEMGGNFSFVGSQYRLEVSDKEYFIDLLFYHRVLRSLVAVELKTGEFKPEYTGKMQFYLAVLNDKVKLKEERPSIGIILCKSKNRTVVEYALSSTGHPIGVASYKLTHKLPEEYKKYLPSADKFEDSFF